MMTISSQDIARCAHLARLEAEPELLQAASDYINQQLQLAQTLLAQPTDGIAPLYRPSPELQELPLGLQADVATSSIDREANMQAAPARQDGLFLVPRVIE